MDTSDYALSLGYSGKDLCEVSSLSLSTARQTPKGCISDRLCYVCVAQVAKSVLALNYTRPEWVGRSDWETLTLNDMQITCAALDAWVARESTLYMEGVSKTRPLVDARMPSQALAQKGMQDASTEGIQQQPEQTLVVPPPLVVDDDREPDKVLYIPKVDVREGGSHAHWLWRGTRISDKHIEEYCSVRLELEDLGSATRANLWGEEAAIREAVELIEYVRCVYVSLSLSLSLLLWVCLSMNLLSLLFCTSCFVPCMFLCAEQSTTH